MTLRTQATVAALATLALLLTAGSASAKSHLDGSLRISNDRMAPLSIRIDGVARGSIPAGATVILGGVANGVRVVKLRGPRGAKVVREVSVAPRKRSSMRVAPIFGRAKMVNRTGITLKVSIDGRFFSTLRDGEKLRTGPMAAGNYRVTAVPAASWGRKGPALTRRMSITPGAPTRVRFDRYLSTLKVTNPFGRGVRLFVGGKSMGRVRAGQVTTINNMVPGVHAVAFKRRGRLLTKNSVTIGMGTTLSFSPQVALHGSMRVKNNFGRRIRLVVDGQDLGRLAAGETRTFTHLRTGTVRGFAKLRGGGRAHFSTEIRALRTAKVSLGRSLPRPIRRTTTPSTRQASW